MTRAIMNGCNGKMGQCITGICAQDEDIEIVAGIDTYDGIKNDYPVFASLKECTVDADVIIDFSNAKKTCLDRLLLKAIGKFSKRNAGQSKLEMKSITPMPRSSQRNKAKCENMKQGPKL